MIVEDLVAPELLIRCTKVANLASHVFFGVQQRAVEPVDELSHSGMIFLFRNFSADDWSEPYDE